MLLNPHHAHRLRKATEALIQSETDEHFVELANEQEAVILKTVPRLLDAGVVFSHFAIDDKTAYASNRRKRSKRSLHPTEQSCISSNCAYQRVYCLS